MGRGWAPFSQPYINIQYSHMYTVWYTLERKENCFRQLFPLVSLLFTRCRPCPQTLSKDRHHFSLERSQTTHAWSEVCVRAYVCVRACACVCVSVCVCVCVHVRAHVCDVWKDEGVTTLGVLHNATNAPFRLTIIRARNTRFTLVSRLSPATRGEDTT